MGTDRHRPGGNITVHAEPGPAPPVRRWPRLALRVAGAGLLITTAAIHLDLYLTGYRSIPTIGWLFLLQVIAGFALGLAVLASGSRLAAAAGAGFALATLGGYLLSLWAGLFGFTEVRTTAGIVAGVIEVAAAAALGMLALTPAPGQPEAGGDMGLAAGLRAGAPGAGWLVAGVSVVALVVLGGSVAAAGGSGGPAYAGSLRTAQIGGVNVLVNGKGFTLYWFAPDTPAKSACNGTCTDYWKPLKGPATLSPGVTGGLATIKRSDGTVQATFDGHPLYTYVSDTAPGQASGNGTNLDGGVWHEVQVP